MAETGLGDLRRRKLPSNAVSEPASASDGPEKMGPRSSPDHGTQIRQWQNGTHTCEFGTRRGCRRPLDRTTAQWPTRLPVNGRMGHPHVTSGRGAGQAADAWPTTRQWRARPPVNSEMGHAHVNWGRRREPRVRRQSSPAAIRCCTLVGIARAASCWDRPACAASGRRRGRLEPSGSWWAGASRAGPGFRGNARPVREP